MIYPPSKITHTATEYLYLAYYPPIIAVFISMVGYNIYSYINGNKYAFYMSLFIFPIIYTSFVVWIHLILDYMLCIINKYGKDSLLDLRTDTSYVPVNIPENNQTNESNIL